MEHARAYERLDEWLDGELGEAESAALSGHVDACAECRREAALRRRLGEALFAPLPAADPRKDEAFVRRVMARVDEEAAPLWERWLGRALTPALGLGLAALLFNILSPGLGSAGGLEAFDPPETQALDAEVP